MEPYLTPVDCACVIHGDAYSWTYVDRLYSMLTRNLSSPVRLHVWTERSRPVPMPYIKHNLDEWPSISGPKRAWWYKLQLFNYNEICCRLLYFDLDVVITGNLDWILQLDTRYFWCIRDFKYIWRPTWQGMNSSMMYWDNNQCRYIWNKIVNEDVTELSKRYHGDQDYLSEQISLNDRKFFNSDAIQSWRWQVNDGGMNMRTRTVIQPGAGAVLAPTTHVVIFHGSPKPHEITDSVIQQHWC